MDNTKTQPKPDSIRKPFGPLTSPKQVLPAMLEIYFAAMKGSATCGHCADIKKGIYNLVTFTSLQMKAVNPLETEAATIKQE